MIKSALSLSDLKQKFLNDKPQILQDFFTFLRFESIATDPNYKPQVVACKTWLAENLSRLGLHVETWETSNAPTLFATDTRAGEGKPTLLLYNHYDVQPVDPLSLWTSPPFDPQIRNGEIYARGAVDNKGQCFYTLYALKTLIEHYGHLPVNLKYIIEGEEESGSSGLFKLIYQNKEKLKADHLLIIDSGFEKKDQPAITLGARGIMSFTLTLTGSKFDLHSGTHGGIAYNPNRALVELLASLRDEKGRVNIPHFYDDVIEVSESERGEIDFEFSESEYNEMFQMKPIGMEKGRNPLEAAWLRPTIEINGISGGYAGTGFKTVIPAKASAKLSCRLVPNQDPQKIGNLICNALKNRVPQGISVEVDTHPGGGPGFRTNPHSKIAKIMSQAYMDVFQKPCKKILLGGSIPISADLMKISGAEMILVGLGLPDDQIHAPNEHFGIDRLEKGFLSIAHMIELLAKAEKY